MLTDNDKKLLKSKNITLEQLNDQLKRFTTGFPYLKLVGSAGAGAGIKVLSASQEEDAIEAWRQYISNGGDVMKFVPASGAASRMFKALYEFANSTDTLPRPGSDIDNLMNHIDAIPFIAELDSVLTRKYNMTAADMHKLGRDKDIARAILEPDGLNYGNMPKALLVFHHYTTHDRTALEEQLAEGTQIAANVDGRVRMHLTVSDNHKQMFEDKLRLMEPILSKATSYDFDVTLSVQKSSTDTIAVNPDNTPFRDEEGNLMFRPGGHGALIENLNDINAEVVFIKNIDNVVPESQREPTLRYKRILGGVLVSNRRIIDEYITMLETDSSPDLTEEVACYMRGELCINAPEYDKLRGNELAAWMRAKLDRPLRVCGMVRNEGEPGGGPFIAYNPDGSSSPQILESTQIDISNPKYADMLKRASHFNPVDLVCYIKDARGRKYDLRRYVDPDTGFISEKSSKGKELRALELPGLWNGAMSDWNTIFVEVPMSTFNPVKTVNDLLRPSHTA